MKRLIALFLLIPALCFADNAICTRDTCPGESYEVAWMNPAIAGASGGAAGCTPSTPGNDNSELGYLTVGSTESVAASTRKIYCMLHTADCSGTLGTAYFFHRTQGSKHKIAVYSTTDTVHSTAPTNGTRLGYTSEITAGADDDWYSAAMSGGTVTQGSKYWLCYLTPTLDGGIAGKHDTGLDRHSIDWGTGEYTTPPASLPTSGWATVADRKMSIFIGIQ